MKLASTLWKIQWKWCIVIQRILKKEFSESKKHLKKCVSSFDIRKIQIKMTFIPSYSIWVNTMKNSSHICSRKNIEHGNTHHYWWKCKLVSPFWQWFFFRKLGIDLHQYPAIQLLGITQRTIYSTIRTLAQLCL